MDLVSGGVVMSGDEATEEGDAGSARRVSMGVNCRLRNLSCMISASTRRSESSSRNRCVSMRKASRSCSPILISSSSRTVRSMATLNLPSRSSREEVVLRACRSKSSLATSISRRRSCWLRFVSRKAVISFCRAACALPASILDCLYLF